MLRKTLLGVGALSIASILGVAAIAWNNMQDRHPGYALDLNLRSDSPAPISVGFAKADITPALPDRWQDNDGNARFEPENGDTWQDGNGNRQFDAVWMAGFGQKRAAANIHDSLWARAIVLDDGRHTLAIVVLDAIGVFHDDVVDIRAVVARQTQLDYVIVAATHVHQAPDLMGLWGESEFSSGVDPDYLKLVKLSAAQAVIKAAALREPAELRYAHVPAQAANLVSDSRRPEVFDAGVRVIHAESTSSGKDLGTLVAWANHPETPWSDNLSITSDFPHYVREQVELHSDSGSVAVYINGAIGGLMTTDPRSGIPALNADSVCYAPTFAKAEAQGRRVGDIALNALENADVFRMGALAIRAKSILLPVDNNLFRLAAGIGVLQRGFVQGFHVRSEIAAWQIGPISGLCVPGEIYPELVNGGIVAPAGQDFEIQPLELPPLRELMPEGMRLVLGLANDEVGYIIPKSEWDEQPPYLYDADSSPYGEVNSLGPETASLLHRAFREICSDLIN